MGTNRKRRRDAQNGREGDQKSQRPRHAQSVSSSHPLKTVVRDLERLLAYNKNLPADVRVEKERELATTRAELALALAEKGRRTMTKRYHMVRFFDRQKATRHLRRIQNVETQVMKCADPDPDKHDAIKRALHVAEVDLNYTIYYPLERPYCSLYPKKVGEDGKEKCDETAWAAGQRGDKTMWELVENAMRQGTLEALKMTLTPKQVPIHSKKPFQTTGKPRTEELNGNSLPMSELSLTRAGGDETLMDDDSDGGFFEGGGGVSLGRA